MKRRLYELLVPRAIKIKLYQMHVDQYKLEEADQRKNYEASYPRAELSSIYISNLKVVPNHTELLGLMPQFKVMAEIGTRYNKLSTRIIAITRPKKAYLIGSLPEELAADNGLDIIEQKFGEQIHSGQVEICHGKIADELYKLHDGSLDWVYLTTDNSYQNTFDLLEFSQLKLKKEGILAGANYSIGDWITMERFGVVEAVNHFCKKHGWEMILITNERNRSLSYALKKISAQNN